MSGRVFEPALTARVDAGDGDRLVVSSPGVGLWRNGPGIGAIVTAGDELGELEVLGVLHRIVAPVGARGRVVERAQAGTARAPVAYGESLLVLDPSIGIGAGATAALASDAAAAAGLVFRAPTSGRFYDRPAPDKAPFVEVGAEIATGHTICLLEVMKTFNRVTYLGGEGHGDGLPPRARVVAIRPRNEDDIDANAVILELEAL